MLEELAPVPPHHRVPTLAEFVALAKRVAELEQRNGHDEWLTIEEAAEYARTSKQRLYDLRSAGRLPKTGNGRKGLVRRSHLDALLDAGAERT